MGIDDAYITYTKAFFKRWVGLYDLFASSIWYAYREGVRELEPCKGKSVLDICCGTGEISLRAAAKGASVTGVDISSDMMACAKKKQQHEDSILHFAKRMQDNFLLRRVHLIE